MIAIASLIAVISAPAVALAQHGGGGHGRGAASRPVVVSRPVIVPPYYSGFYDPFYGYHNPFFMNWYGWGFPGFYAPMFYGRGFSAESSARLQVTPKQAEVYVDGYYAGIVDDFDGFAQRLRVAPGEHVIELYLDGHKSVKQSILFQPNQTYRIKHVMQPLAAGDAAPERPRAQPRAAPAEAAPYDALGRADRSAPVAGGAATIAIRVQPGDAIVLIDGERWQTSGTDRLEVQVSPGEHRIEIQKDGYQPFTTTVRVGAGGTSPVNVSLTKSGQEQ
ncbi:MAG: PEGA domain-containing protein [Cyanobacteria bacterium]|nr:PEGA domain-containing protein [Cyanobacteriota bacterium]